MNYLNRDISWLGFNQRVMDETKKNIPLEEKVMFFGIVSSNLDEFLQVRYPTALASMGTSLCNNFQKKLRSHMIDSIQTTDKFLEKHGIVRKFRTLNKDDRKLLNKYFRSNVYPTIQAITIRKSKQLNPIAGIYLLVITKDSNDNEAVNYIELPRSIPRFIPVRNKYTVKLEDLIASNLKYIFHNRKIVSYCAFSIIRSADVYIQEDDYEDPFHLISRTLHERDRAWITRVEITTHNKKMIRIIKDILPLTEDTIIVSNSGIMMSDLKKLDSAIFAKKDRARKFSPYNTFPSGSIFSYIKSEDRLALHPYESFQSTVVRFIEEAADDPNVVSIKISLYRVSEHSQIIDSLLKAADQGKLVTVLVELKARFDEHHNIEISKILQEGGVRLVYTKPNIKTHSKVCLVTRKEKNGKIRIYSHIGTGNYSEGNGKLYTDYSYFTANQDIGYDLSRFFNILTSDQGIFKSKHIIYAPHNMRETITDLIDRETKKAKKGKNARIICKCNALTDKKIAHKLTLAAKAGVKVILIIRGACILEPKKDLRIYSIVGRWLEHSRILAFGVGSDAEVYIGSSDMMYRNLSCRNELMINVENKGIKARILKHLKMYLADTVNRREIKGDYKYKDIKPTRKKKKYNAQEEMAKEAKKLAL